MGVSDTDLFQDRTPRPHINFKKMNEIDNTLPFAIREKGYWVEHYAKCALKRVEEHTIYQKTSWQDDMIKILKKKIIEDYIRNTTEQQFKINKISLQVENTHI
jgi:hypothetical protein